MPTPTPAGAALLEQLEDEWTRTGTISPALYARLYGAVAEAARTTADLAG